MYCSLKHFSFLFYCKVALYPLIICLHLSCQNNTFLFFFSDTGLLQGSKEHVNRVIRGPSVSAPEVFVKFFNCNHSMELCTAFLHITFYSFQDAKCELCEFLVTIIDKELGQNASLEKINSTIYGLCNLLPAAIKPEVSLN